MKNDNSVVTIAEDVAQTETVKTVKSDLLVVGMCVCYQ